MIFKLEYKTFQENASENVPVFLLTPQWVDTLRPRQNGRHFADEAFKRIFLNEYVRISIKISLKFVARGPINNIPALVQIMAWCRSGDKPLSEPMKARLPTHTRPQWVKYRTMYVLVWWTVSVLNETAREINTKITLERVHKKFVTRVHTLFYFLQDNKSINDHQINDFHTLTLCLARFKFCIIDCLWHQSQWPYNCHAITWNLNC